VSRADHRRGARRIALLLSVILIPTAAVILLVFRVVHQENELSERRASEERRQALGQVRRELTARLHALRLEQVNRLIGESGLGPPPDSPIIFVARVLEGHMALPWEAAEATPATSVQFERWQREGESREFRQGDADGAVASYRRALEAAGTAWEKCSASVSLARSYRRAGNESAARGTDLDALSQCGDVVDGDGVPFGLYAAQRLLTSGGATREVTDYLVHRVSAVQWRSPNERSVLRSLLQRLANPVVDGPMSALEADAHRAEQISALAQGVHERLARLQQASRSAPGDLSWIGFGDEPWLLTLVSPTSFATPVVMAVSSRKVVPPGVTLRTTPAPDAVPLGAGFVDLHVQWPPGQFAVPPVVPGLLYGSVLAFVLGAAMLAGYFLLRDVQREMQIAEMRSHFVASVSHELKTPLTSIRAHAETLLMGRAASSESTVDYLRTIVSESERLTRLVDSVLDFSRIEQGSKAYHLQTTRLRDVVSSAARTIEDPLAQLGFTMNVVDDGSDPTVRADPEALAQALLNLLGNAMKYSGEARQIEMRIGTRDGQAFVDVVDHGIGIPRDEQRRIFERFHRVQSVDTTGIAGTGLGLPLALHVVEAHRGRIAVASEPGRGSTFSVCIPLEAQT
jgi:signal transduction histidine kinase